VAGLDGWRVLVAEDNWVVADELSRALTEAGALAVGPVSSVQDVVDRLAPGEAPNAAVLDINLRGEWIYPAVDRLMRLGVYVVFLTGYDAETIPRAYRTIPCFEKPTAPDRIVAALATARARN